MTRRLMGPLAAGLLLGLLAFPALADDPPSAAANRAFLAANRQKPGVGMLPSGLEYRIVRSGFGGHPSPADTVEIAYDARLINGRMVDSASADLPANLQVSNLMPGLREAVEHMQVGDRWQLFIPANLAFGGKGNASVPPDQTLVFDITLMAVTPPQDPQAPGQSPISIYGFNRGTEHQAGAMFTLK
ncbi:MAG: FKBP-type peptidyl-prolyl cis-trans isomerase, partial [Rhizomicrobium sp.]